MQRQKLELEVNRPVEVELLFDEPIVGQNQYGNYQMFGVKVGDAEYVFFSPSEEVSQVLKELTAGQKATITKLVAKRGSRIVSTYDVTVNGKVKSQPNQTVTQTDEPEEVKEQEPKSDRYYEIMLQSFKDAIKISNELNGMVEPTRVAITLFIQRTKNGNGHNGFNY